jgi:hypothetical protein
MMSLSYVHREEQIKEQVKMQSAKGKWQSQGGFCLLHFAFCLLTCSSLSPATTAPREDAYC